MDIIREKFIRIFGDEEARKIEEAAFEHNNPIHCNTGSSPFRWALVICIGYQCFEKLAYRKYHKIKVPYEKLKKWIIEYADLKNHDGDCDYLSMFVGVYNEYVGIR